MSDQSAGSLGGHYGMLSQQISSIGSSVDEVKGLVGGLDVRLREIELDEAANKALTANRIDAAHRRLDKSSVRMGVFNERLDLIEKKMPYIDDILALRTKLLVLVFMSGFLGTSIAGMFLGLIFNYLFKEFL